MNFFLVTLFSFFLAVQALPLSKFAPRANLDVWVPTIVTPDKNSVWKKGEKETVKWLIDNQPQTITNHASITLHTPNIAEPSILLADGFNLRTGSQVVTVPLSVEPGQYQITLFGDSGDFSETFTIVE